MALRRGGSSATTLDTPPFEVEALSSPTEDPGVLPITSGWDEAEANRGGDSRFPDRLKPTEDPVLIKFLTDAPISWKQHFISSVKRPFVCIKRSDPRGCPLCAVGDVPKDRHMMSVADLSGENAVVKKLEFGNRLLDDLKAVHDGPKGPLTRFCVRLSSRGKGFEIKYIVDVVKDRDLEEEEGITPEDVAEALEGLEPLGVESIFVSKYEDIAEVAESLV